MQLNAYFRRFRFRRTLRWRREVNSAREERSDTDGMVRTSSPKKCLESDMARPFTTRGRTIEAWKPPQTWDCISDDDFKRPPKRKTILKIPEEPFRNEVQECQPWPVTIELTHLQRNIRRMEAASPKIVLERLKEEWNEIADASVYRELELEKQLWMLTALRSLRKKSSNEQMAADASLNEHTKVLSLYENHGK